jgi:endonuclease/exonuclease/phosphatase family metal-dependent hydrolase
VAIAAKSKTDQGCELWIVTTHLIKADSDKDGGMREKAITEIMQNMATFEATVPIILCGDMNIFDATVGSYGKGQENYSSLIFEKTIGKVLRFGFTRGEAFHPSPSSATFCSWDNTENVFGSWGILDYILVNDADRCTANCPVIVNYNKANDKIYASDHKGMSMEIGFGS